MRLQMRKCGHTCKDIMRKGGARSQFWTEAVLDLNFGDKHRGVGHDLSEESSVILSTCVSFTKSVDFYEMIRPMRLKPTIAWLEVKRFIP